MSESPASLTDDELEEMATVTPEDIEDAAEFWEANAPEPYKPLIDATEEDEE